MLNVFNCFFIQHALAGLAWRFQMAKAHAAHQRCRPKLEETTSKVLKSGLKVMSYEMILLVTF